MKKTMVLIALIALPFGLSGCDKKPEAPKAEASKAAASTDAMSSMAMPAGSKMGKDGRICLTNSAAERALRAIARGRKAWLFVGSDRGGERAAMMYTLIATCRLNDVDPLLWLTDVLTRIAGISQNRLDELLPWTWKQLREQIDTAQAA